MENKKFRKDYIKSWQYLDNVLTPFEYKVAHKISMLAKPYTNSLEPLGENTKLKDLSKLLNISKNKIKPIIDKLKSLGIFATSPSSKKHWVLNPFVSTNEYTPTKIITFLFENTIFAKMQNQKLDNEIEVNENHNLYILSQEVGNQVYYKLGYSSKLKQRIKTYQYHNPGITLSHSFYLEDAKTFEKEFHKQNKAVYLNEWYDYSTIEKVLPQ